MKCLEKNPNNRFADGAELYSYVQAKIEAQECAVKSVQSEAGMDVMAIEVAKELTQELVHTRNEMQHLKDEVLALKQQLQHYSALNNSLAKQLKDSHREVNDMLMQIWSALIFDAPEGAAAPDGGIVVEESDIFDADDVFETKDVEEMPSSGGYRIGDYYDDGGVKGIVFDVDNDGLHGKIMSVEAFVACWCCSQQYEKRINVGADNTDDGEDNTNLLMSKEDISEYPAFDLCRELGEGWYLPAVQEMGSIYAYIETINEALERINKPQLLLKEYWTSTESNEITAQFIRLDDGKMRGNFKFCNYQVRAVRKF